MGLGVWVLLRNSKQRLNRVFFFAVLLGFIYLFSRVMMWVSPDSYSAFLWDKVGTIWPIFTALIFNFALVFTDNHWTKNKIHYAVIYLPAITFFLIDLTTELINTAPVMKARALTHGCN
jgi:hypothetical protein